MASIIVDIESDEPISGDFSMISFGAVLVDEHLDKTFYGQLKPISEKFCLSPLKSAQNFPFGFVVVYRVGHLIS